MFGRFRVPEFSGFNVTPEVEELSARLTAKSSRGFSRFGKPAIAIGALGVIGSLAGYGAIRHMRNVRAMKQFRGAWNSDLRTRTTSDGFSWTPPRI